MERARARFTKDNVGVKGDGGLKERLDTANEAVKKGGDPHIKTIIQDLDPELLSERSSGESSGGGMIVIGVLVAGLGLYFMS